jgi:hypothetical protein
VSREEGFITFLAFDIGAEALQTAAHGHLHHLDSFVRADPRGESLGLEGTVYKLRYSLRGMANVAYLSKEWESAES